MYCTHMKWINAMKILICWQFACVNLQFNEPFCDIHAKVLIELCWNFHQEWIFFHITITMLFSCKARARQEHHCSLNIQRVYWVCLSPNLTLIVTLRIYIKKSDSPTICLFWQKVHCSLNGLLIRLKQLNRFS